MPALQVRKLEFLMAAAKAAGHDCVITIGGIQSNHCRATAVAARSVELQHPVQLSVLGVHEAPCLVEGSSASPAELQ